MRADPDDEPNHELSRVTGHEIGISAVTQHGAVVALELLLDDRPED